jgi:hypothetical protein
MKGVLVCPTKILIISSQKYWRTLKKVDTMTELYKNICWQFDVKSPEEAEKEGYKWYETL